MVTIVPMYCLLEISGPTIHMFERTMCVSLLIVQGTMFSIFVIKHFSCILGIFFMFLLLSVDFLKLNFLKKNISGSYQSVKGFIQSVSPQSLACACPDPEGGRSTQSYQARIQPWAIIGMAGKTHLNGVSRADR